MACLTPFFMDVTDRISGLTTPMLIPCGKCEECLKRKQSDWISRLYVETQMALSSFFVTLTYDENHLPYPDGVNKDDCQRFFKRFRKNFSVPLKYFLVSEYGSISSRPHYHVLMFFREKIDWIILSNYLADCWPLGQHKIGFVSLASIRYCAKYCLKSKHDPRNFYRNKTFALMSRRPAIGYDLLSVSKDYQSNDSFEVVCGNYVVSMCRYYRDKIHDDLAKFNHAQEMQKKYKDRPSALTAYDRYIKRVRFERKQQTL